MNIVISGFMGCGKSTVGRILSKLINREFCDTDELIEKYAQISVSEIFERNGEEYFRNLESKICMELSKKKNIIISTGGGALLRPQNAKILDESGIIFYLEISAETAINRLSGDKSRPLIRRGEVEIRKLLESRRSIYRRTAHHIIDGENPPEIVAENIIELTK